MLVVMLGRIGKKVLTITLGTIREIRTFVSRGGFEGEKGNFEDRYYHYKCCLKNHSGKD